MKAVILAAGKGTRLSPYTSIIPKPLLPVGLKKDGSFKTIIERQIEQLIAAKVSEIIIVVNYHAQQVKSYIASVNLPCKICFVHQTSLTGNGGAFYKAQRMISGTDVIVVDCDNFIEKDSVFADMAMSHKKAKADITVGVGKVKNISKFAIIKTDNSGCPTDIFEKPTNRSKWGNLAKSGAMILSGKTASLPKVISKAKSGEYTTTQIIKYCIKTGKNVYLHKLKFSDIGTWKDYVPVLRDGISLKKH